VPSTKARVRRSPEAAKALFLKCAEELLVSQGLAAVQMRAVARSANVTDAAVAHHFRNRDGLLEALMNQVAAKVRGAIGAAAEAWTGEASTVLQLVSILDDLYSKGYAELAQALYSAGWRETGSPILNPVAETLIATNQNPTMDADDIRRVLATLHMDLALSPIYGAAFQQSVGLKARPTRRVEHLKWWAHTIETMLSDRK
jgi:AcrR family transcriptional regulator